MYIDNCKSYQKQIIDRFSPAKALKSFFTARELEQLTLLQFQLAERVKWTSTSNNIQPVCDIGKVMDAVPWLGERIKEQIGEFYSCHSGNFFITTQLHDAHVDLLTATECYTYSWSNNVVPYKSVVIPLLITEDAKAHTAFFNQRHIGYSVTLDRVGVSEQENSDYSISREYPEFTEYGNKTDADVIFPHIPEGNMQGLSVETVLDYVPGDIMIFDACQIHASCVKPTRPNYRWLKSGINIQFYKEV